MVATAYALAFRRLWKLVLSFVFLAEPAASRVPAARAGGSGSWF